MASVFAQNLVCGGVAGITAVSCVFPIDMVKTRLMNQRSQGGEQFTGAVDCFKKIVRNEGVGGLYRGLPANLVGITPEKAIKLAGNDFFRTLFGSLYFKKPMGEVGNNKQQLPFLLELAAGGCAGLVQVVATNPMEIVKIRMQTSKGINTSQVVRELGLSGLYKGTSATLLRDIPFSMLYFSLYARTKHAMRDEKTGHIGLPAIIVASVTAASISAGLTTPCDVIKTRMQAHGAENTGVLQNYRQIVAETGHKGLFKGVTPRVLIMMPLFAITLSVYELMQNMLGIKTV